MQGEDEKEFVPQSTHMTGPFGSGFVKAAITTALVPAKLKLLVQPEINLSNCTAK